MNLIVPALQRSLNILLRQHWTKFAKQQAVFDMLLHQAYFNRKCRTKDFKGKTVKITYTLYFPDKRKRDYSNYAQKMLDDSLVKEGIIDDDNSNVVVEEVVRIRFDKDNPRTEILIEEAFLN